MLPVAIPPEIFGTTAPLPWFEANGFYRVGNRITPHKILALQEATRTKQPLSWDFNSQVFGSFNWRERLHLDLLELYRLRAQQLRQKYKYIIALWSGGGDSTTMIESFLRNGIHLDEVVCIWPISDSQKLYQPNPDDISGENYPSEWNFSILPQIHKLRKLYPNLNLNIVDQRIVEHEEYHDDTVLISERHSYLTIQRWRNLDEIIQSRQDVYGDGVATIWGVSPPDIFKIDDWLGMRFFDSMMGANYVSDFTLRGVHRKVEYFYWSPDMPELIREQAHVMLDDLNRNPENLCMIEHLKMNKNGTMQSIYLPNDEIKRRWRKRLLYPHFPQDTFQVTKQLDTHSFATWETWFHRQPHAREFLDPWASAIKEHQNIIDPKFMNKNNGVVTSYIKCMSPFYPIGKLLPDNNHLAKQQMIV